MNTPVLFLILAHVLVIPVTFAASFVITRRQHSTPKAKPAAMHIHTPHAVGFALINIVGDILTSR